jgi:hypothetical protein
MQIPELIPGAGSTATMPEGKKPAIFRYAKFNVEALCRLASALRQGIACTCDMNQHPATGSFNWAIFVSFEDGIQWVLRSPHNLSKANSSELSSKLLASEAATLRYLRLKSDIPVPEVYGYRYGVSKFEHYLS